MSEPGVEYFQLFLGRIDEYDTHADSLVYVNNRTIRHESLNIAGTDNQKENVQGFQTRTEEPRPFKSRKLGRNGPLVSQVGLGCIAMFDIYGSSDETENVATIHAAVYAGVPGASALLFESLALRQQVAALK
jgi:hypothetical protein